MPPMWGTTVVGFENGVECIENGVEDSAGQQDELLRAPGDLDVEVDALCKVSEGQSTTKQKF